MAGKERKSEADSLGVLVLFPKSLKVAGPPTLLGLFILPNLIFISVSMSSLSLRTLLSTLALLGDKARYPLSPITDERSRVSREKGLVADAAEPGLVFELMLLEERGLYIPCDGRFPPVTGLVGLGKRMGGWLEVLGRRFTFIGTTGLPGSCSASPTRNGWLCIFVVVKRLFGSSVRISCSKA